MIERINRLKDKNVAVILIVMGALLINFLGRGFAENLQLPIWLDCIGTCLIAYMYGPMCGAIVGAAVHISYGFSDHRMFAYALTGAMIGTICGWMARKRYFDNFYKMNNIVALLILVSVAITSPINLFLRGGYTTNLWGDGVFDMLKELGMEAYVAAFVAQFVVDFLDKYITVLIVYIILKIHHKRMKRRQQYKDILSVIVLAVGILISAQTVDAREINTDKLKQGFFTCTLYNDRNGLPGGEANDIAFTNDGYVWIGTYSGLYQYDGTDFQIKHSNNIKSVNCMCGDDEGRIWVGTNDRGLTVLVDGEIANVVDTTNGLASNSVSCIAYDGTGYYYIGTKEKLCVIKIVGGMEVSSTISEVDYACSIASDEEGLTVAVTNMGEAFVLKEGKLLYSFKNKQQSEGFSSVVYCDGEFLLGTFENDVVKYKVDDAKAKKTGSISTKDLRNIKSIMEEDDGKKWVCASNGIGYWMEENDFQILNTGSFNGSIDKCGVDYQGNLWFVSSRLGLLKVSESIFANIYAEGNYETDVVNAITKWNGLYYIGSDDGVDIMSTNYALDTGNELVKALEGQRIRNFLVDSKNHLWISISNGSGLCEVDQEGKIKWYTEEDGLICNRFRSAIELKDGTIAVAEDGGIDFIKNGKVTGQLTSDDGFVNPMVLSLWEASDGYLYAGTDGGGLYRIKDSKIIDKITMENGLSSDVILRIVEGDEGLYLVASDGINYLDKNGNVSYLDQFPYSNNYDLYADSKGNVWVLSSNGIYVVKEEHLLSNHIFDYVLLDSKYGLNGAITGNSWCLATEDGNLFIPCDNGCYMVNTNHYEISNVPYRMTTDFVMADDLMLESSDSRLITIPGDSKDIVFHIVVPNYTANEIYVGYILQGYENQENVVSAKELGEIKYPNLPSGNYQLVLNLYDETKTNLLESVYYNVEKEMRIYDYRWFRIYFLTLIGLFLIWSTWMIIKNRNDRLMQKEREKLRRLEQEARISNETIMAIAKTVDAKDQRTSKHSERVAQYSVCIARALGWKNQECEDLYKTGLLHDIGKIGIPDAVLNKPGKLTDEEYAIMKTHVDKGAEILKGFTIVENVDLGTRFHHERYDGKGYPKGLVGEEIPIQARIIGIADAFDAMTSNRVYRHKLDLADVLAEMKRCAGTQFDPELTEVFLGLIEDGTIDVEVLYEDK